MRGSPRTCAREPACVRVSLRAPRRGGPRAYTACAQGAEPTVSRVDEVRTGAGRRRRGGVRTIHSLTRRASQTFGDSGPVGAGCSGFTSCFVSRTRPCVTRVGRQGTLGVGWCVCAGARSRG
eukprot:6206024-Pleurochrysis_carterae.AAC.1